MTPWCREQIPVEGNFGRLFDQLNLSIQQLSSEFSAEVEVQVRHSLACQPSDSPRWRPPQLTGAPSPTTTTTSGAASAGGSARGGELQWSGGGRTAATARASGAAAAPPAAAHLLHLRHHLHSVSHFLLCRCPAHFLLHHLLAPPPFRAFSYLRCYLNDIHFDNIYVTARFQHIDARRKRAVSLRHPSA